MKTIAFTGHRPDKLPMGYGDCNNTKSLCFLLWKQLEKELEQHEDVTLISGGAIGFDQLVITVSALLSCSSRIRRMPSLTIAEPFPRFWNKWPKDVQRRYLDTYQQLANDIVIVSPYLEPENAPFYKIAEAMQLRNVWMVDHADEVWAFWNGSKGGTANCVKYAERINKPVRNLFTEYN